MDPDVMDTIVGFVSMVSSAFDVIKDGIALFMTPPLSYFVVLGFAAAGVTIAKRLVPRKKAK